MSEISQRGYDAEILALDILEKIGYEIIYAPEKEKRDFQIKNKKFDESEIQKLWDKTSEKFLKAREGYSGNQWDSIARIKKIKDEFYKVDAIHHKALEKLYDRGERRKIKKILDKEIGKSIMPQINKQMWLDSFENKDKLDNLDKKWIKDVKNEEMITHSFVDVFCKKDDIYYVFDIKHKTFKENKNLNSFDVTNYEVLNYNRIFKENKVKLKIMVILGKSGISYYRIFDWDEFTVPTKFDPNTKHRTKIKLKEGFDISKLKAV